MAREQFASRLGFILVSAGCAIGLGNVWRFPYLVGQYGGAAFVLLILLFLVIMGLPIVIMEFSFGRASRKGIARSFDALEPEGSKWHRFKWIGLVGSSLLLMFYAVVAGWMLAFFARGATGAFDGLDSAGAGALFNGLIGDPIESIAWTVVVLAVSVAVNRAGLQKGIERVTKVMMAALFVVLVVLCVRSVMLPGAKEGLAFYLMPDFGKLFAGSTPAEQWGTLGQAVAAAMGQAFFMVSVGIGSMSIFGSHMGRERRVSGEAVNITALNVLVAILAGFIIFPSCFTYGVEPASGPSLVFVALPTVFGQMPLGGIWGTLFFLFLSFASLSTVIGIFENVAAFVIDEWGIDRNRACIGAGVALMVLCVPCALGFNVWSGFEVPGIGNVQSLEDFLLSNTILPIGCLIFIAFCTSKRGWGWDAFIAEANTGEGMRFPRRAYAYVKYVLPAAIAVIFIAGYAPVVATWVGLLAG